ncbi:YkgJ family cysteine cluster protein [Porphyrobacter sp. YT40]|uniref:YkgJ family cysteine cluster protein n=1 Tax=Porphyrobacter sp. YT40 TaxID=2547601 RepID=UPI0011434821|nr:YkgJ family cysteine cluster protein [Porphyrobacter sp. YT40]QDH34777.1 YkgJ family cysteine cluster protein [Porphyrobacter sp. YT40]
MADTDLCTRCGLCCSGALFDFGPLAAGEVEQARADDLAVLEAEGEFGFALPCPALDGACCTVYATRPATCRAYRCKLLRALEGEDMTFAEAVERVEEARAMMAALTLQLPPGMTVTDLRRMRRRSVAAENTAPLMAPPHLMIALGMLDLVLDQHFRKASERQIMPRG